MQPVKRTTSIHLAYYFISGGLLLLVALGWAVLIASASDSNAGAFNFACPSAVLVLGAAALFIGVRQQMVVSRVSRPEVSLSTQNPRVGDCGERVVVPPTPPPSTAGQITLPIQASDFGP